MAAGEDHVGAREEIPLALLELGRRSAERRELVHAVVHHRRAGEVPREAEGHRRIKPEDRIANAAASNHRVEESALRVFDLGSRKTMRQMRHGDPEARAGFAHLHAGPTLVEDGLLDEKDAVVAREPAHQMIRALVDETPAEMRQTDHVLRGFTHRLGSLPFDDVSN